MSFPEAKPRTPRWRGFIARLFIALHCPENGRQPHPPEDAAKGRSGAVVAARRGA
jgi:hypothetical protein